ncbi:bactofilin family protein [Aliivibrio salmonicida]|uniref:bactofilin family protein n=1 Tax=Aliivibrio salmonicida TaxID=40269 RepID=UPI00406C7B1C
MGLFSSRSTTASLSIIAKGCRVIGNIETDQSIQIDGFVQGNIITEAEIIITPTGRVQGDIKAGLVLINGLVEGTCEGKEVNIQPKGKFKGTMQTQHLTIEKGGLLIGENREVKETDKVTKLQKVTPTDLEEKKAG